MSDSLYCFLTKNRLQYVRESLTSFINSGLSKVDSYWLDGNSDPETLEHVQSVFKFSYSDNKVQNKFVGYEGTYYEGALYLCYLKAKSLGYSYFTIIESDIVSNEPDLFNLNEQLLKQTNPDCLSLYNTYPKFLEPLNAVVKTNVQDYHLYRKNAVYWGIGFCSFSIPFYEKLINSARSTLDALDVTIGKTDICAQHKILVTHPSCVFHIGLDTSQNQTVPFHQAAYIAPTKIYERLTNELGLPKHTGFR